MSEKVAKTLDSPSNPSSSNVTPVQTAGLKDKPVTHEHEKKKLAFITRTIWTFVMIAFFLLIVTSGPLALIGTVFIFQILTFKEIIALTAEPARDKKIPWNKTLNWYFLFTTVYYFDGESFFRFFREFIISSKVLTILSINHNFICYLLYIAGFVFFVWTLKKGYYRFQFAQLAATHLTLLLVVYQSHLIIANLLNGLFWFLLPISLVIINDIFAYICGITFGRTQLIEISPKKTVEGFVGAWVCTSIAAVVFSFVLSQSDYITCPAVTLTESLFDYPHCDPHPVFIPQIYQLPVNVAQWVGFDLISLKPVYFHSAIIATFASLIAPFGGFFASGLKRAFGIKDFGDTIPGHGGITDRFDCQFLMGSFSYLYYQTFITSDNVNTGTVLQMAIINLSAQQVTQLVKSLLKYLNTAGHLSDEKLAAIQELLSE